MFFLLYASRGRGFVDVSEQVKRVLNVYAVFCYLTEFRSQFRFCISRRVNSFEMKRAPSLFSYANVVRDSLIASRLIPLRGVEEILFKNIKSWRRMCDVADISSLCKYISDNLQYVRLDYELSTILPTIQSKLNVKAHTHSDLHTLLDICTRMLNCFNFRCVPLNIRILLLGARECCFGYRDLCYS